MPAAFALDLGHDLPAPALPPGLFGAPRYTPEQQAAEPHEPLTRVIKDILTARTIRVVDEANGDRQLDWTITEPILREIADAHAVARSRGYATVLGKTHGDPSTRLIHPDDHVAVIHEMKVADGVLWASAYVTPAQAAELRKPTAKVSPYIKAGVRDTGGHLYPLRAMHVAVTDNPRVPGQGQFLVALCDPVTGRDVPMTRTNASKHPLFAVALAEGDDLEEIDGEGGGDTALSGGGTAKLIEQVTDLLDAAYGLALPEGTTETNLVDRLELLMSVAKQMSGETDTAEDAVEESVASGAIPMSQRVRPKPKPAPKVDALREAERRGEAKARYEFALAQAGREGVAADVIEAKRVLGEKYGYDPAFLAGLPTAVPMGNPLAGHRDTSAPPVRRTPTGRPDEKRIKSHVERMLKRAGR